MKKIILTIAIAISLQSFAGNQLIISNGTHRGLNIQLIQLETIQGTGFSYLCCYGAINNSFDLAINDYGSYIGVDPTVGSNQFPFPPDFANNIIQGPGLTPSVPNGQYPIPIIPVFSFDYMKYQFRDSGGNGSDFATPYTKTTSDGLMTYMELYNTFPEIYMFQFIQI